MAPAGLEVAVDEETFELRLDPVLEAASAARRAARGWLAGSEMSSARFDDLQLVISELVTNAVIHARTPLRLVVHLDGQRVLTEVFDADSRLPRPTEVPGPHGGRGLMLVDRLSDRWGCEPSSDGKRVWAELRLDD
jgi:anti-sigma regulatory factor (Ser/Thr protein kinase)